MKNFWRLMDNAITFSDRIKLASFVLKTNKFTNGEKVKELENAWNDWLGSKYSLFVSSGSTANMLLISAAMKRFNIKKGDKVLVPACTWMTNVAPIMQLGLKPVFCDISFKDFSFDRNSLLEVRSKHTEIKLIFVTHLLGFPSETRINGFLEQLFPEAYILDDVCESHGCLVRGNEKVGCNSLGATFSTYFGHHLTTIEGGFVSTNDEELFDLMKMKRSHGLARESKDFKEYSQRFYNIDPQFLFITDGFNFRNTELAAVLGLCQIKKLDKSIEIRNKNYKNFIKILKKWENNFYVMENNPLISSFCLPLICKNYSTYLYLLDEFGKNGIEYRPIVSGNLLRQPFLTGHKLISSFEGNLTGRPNVDILHERGLYIGNSQFINNKHLNKLELILEKCNEI